MSVASDPRVERLSALVTHLEQRIEEFEARLEKVEPQFAFKRSHDGTLTLRDGLEVRPLYVLGRKDPVDYVQGPFQSKSQTAAPSGVVHRRETARGVTYETTTPPRETIHIDGGAGRITIQAGKMLSEWISGADHTLIDGGKITANTLHIGGGKITAHSIR